MAQDQLDLKSIQSLKTDLRKAGKRGITKPLFLQKIHKLNLPENRLGDIMYAVCCHWDTKAEKFFPGYVTKMEEVVEIVIVTKNGECFTGDSESLGRMKVTIKCERQ